jgi:hypothetical protein
MPTAFIIGDAINMDLRDYVQNVSKGFRTFYINHTIILWSSCNKLTYSTTVIRIQIHFFKLFVPCIFSTYGIKTNWCHYFNFIYTECPRRKGQNFGRVFLMLKYTDITQNTYVQSWTVMEIMAREVWNFDSCYTLTDYQTHIKTGRNMWFL